MYVIMEVSRQTRVLGLESDCGLVTDSWWSVTAMLIDSREQLIVGLLVALCLKYDLINCCVLPPSSHLCNLLLASGPTC